MIKAVEKGNRAGFCRVFHQNNSFYTLHCHVNPPRCHFRLPGRLFFFQSGIIWHFCQNFYMTTQQINLIRATWKLVAANADEAGPLFYETLFEIAPELKPMFSRTTVPE